MVSNRLFNPKLLSQQAPRLLTVLQRTIYGPSKLRSVVYHNNKFAYQDPHYEVRFKFGGGEIPNNETPCFVSNALFVYFGASMFALLLFDTFFVQRYTCGEDI